MAANRDKPDRWKSDIARSVDFYNSWFLEFAPEAFRDTRARTTRQVEDALRWTRNLKDIGPEVLRGHPGVLQMLRMATCPPIARDRLIGLSGARPSAVKNMELRGSVPPKMAPAKLHDNLQRVVRTIRKLIDPDIFVWLASNQEPNVEEVHRAATIVADRICGAVADPIIRNAQERRQLATIAAWLEQRQYARVRTGQGIRFDRMEPGSFAFRMNVPVRLARDNRGVNVPVDVAVLPRGARPGALPLLIEAKSAGDFTNVNKRRKEETTKITQLRATYGAGVRYILFLCGYFDGGYLGYEAAEGIDRVWEHRVDELAEFGL